MRSHRRKVIVAAAVVAVTAGAGGAVAATTSGSQRAESPRADARPGLASRRTGSGFGVRGGLLSVAGSYLGLTVDQLRSQLESGKTLAQIADATAGKSASGLIAALTAAAKSKLDAAVSAGTLTAAQEAQIESMLQQQITDLVNGTLGHRHDGSGFGFGFGFGQPFRTGRGFNSGVLRFGGASV